MTGEETIIERLKDHEVADKANFSEISGKLDRILIQTTEHNHRLTKVERNMYMIVGGLVVVSAIVVPLFLQMLK